MKIYGDVISGNCLKVKRTADALAIPFTGVPIDILRGESRPPAYLKKLPQGQVPAVEFDDGRRLAQSNAVVASARVALEGGFGRTERQSFRKWVAHCELSLRIH